MHEKESRKISEVIVTELNINRLVYKFKLKVTLIKTYSGIEFYEDKVQNMHKAG